ncbi:MAG: maleylpyruvate isomerase family mycothiol-dependent enzyme, partial [Actinobacteria bacterium]|nr:maleylpyruvate isomerase family mycothiol-dependent enzyme [Actinomycetota bacterium]NIS36101.1 maleylpyruvate isomerase family mycothiol-dependent enzyme [Actinomycetota bacterium]NIU22157.1 maleylpyruvate isomerase family mycothiol-dependent enzyme [Actinomycetota bacterium]NIU70675.1 maleylpyruvate isomerase family mycothiol-dependent enzyme [Actinomycetota bacterium]NIV90274.1 maleylpyruvate isomerase family mycothiol-dependent enzyme [Actinomycetota bacterium]
MTIDYRAALREESARFLDAAVAAGPRARVPSCPDWDGADLLWHLAEVQYFWGSIVDGLIRDPAGVPDLERPSDAELGALFQAQSDRLQAALATRSDDEPCWSWATDRTVGFVRRRQAHEAAIHRVDAELAAARPVTPLGPEFAEDGIQELFDHMVGGEPPDWATVTPEGSFIALESDSGRRWVGEFARFAGTSPRSGRVYDMDDVQFREQAPP